MTVLRGRRSKQLAEMPEDEREEEFARRRHEMVESQIERRGVRDPDVLAALRSVPRHRFVPEALWVDAYEDCPLPLSNEQTISQPYIVGLMSELLRVAPGDTVLEIGTGSGYQAAVLAEMKCEVYSIEIVEPLANTAETTLREVGCANVHCRLGDGHNGWPEHAPFDGIIVTAAPDIMPLALIDQLKEGRRLVVPVGDRNQDLYVVEKTPTGADERSIIPVRFVPMTGHG